MKAPRIPDATYRLQFNRDFTFTRAAALVPYLAASHKHSSSSPSPAFRMSTKVTNYGNSAWLIPTTVTSWTSPFGREPYSD